MSDFENAEKEQADAQDKIDKASVQLAAEKDKKKAAENEIAKLDKEIKESE